jgi:biotin carboxyl carrier protein
MKMENEVPAHRHGTVGEVRVGDGQAVQAGEVLATID